MSRSASQPSPVTLSELESHLGEAANILRGSPVDRADWKSYILPLLFFKRICDVRKSVLVIDASSHFRKGRAQSFLEREHGQQILSRAQQYVVVQDQARVVSIKEIEQ